MRLRSLELMAYGAFSGQAVEFRPGARLHLVVGPNESGKTTRRMAVADLLYGFEHRSDYAFRHGTGNLRVGGRVEANGVVHDLVRRKGRVQTLFDPTGAPVDPGVLASGLGGIDRATYVKLGSISQDELKDGARILLEDEGAVASALFGAASGGFRARVLLDELQDQIDSIFKPQGQNYPLNRAVRAFEEALVRCRRVSTDADAWNELAAEIGRLEADAKEADRRVSDLEGCVTALGRMLDVVPKLEELERHTFALAELAKGALVPREGVADVRELLRELRERGEEWKKTESALAELRLEHERSELDPGLAQAYEEIAALARDAGAIRKAVDDLTGNRLVEKRDEARREVGAALARTWPGASLDDVRERISVIRDALPRARQAMRHHVSLAQSMAAAAAELRRVGDDVARVSEDLRRLGPAVDATPLEAALAGAEQAGNVDDEAGRLTISIAEHDRRLVAELLALGIELPDPLACREFALPLPTTIERFRERFGEIEARAAALASAREAARAAVAVRRAAPGKDTDAAMLASVDELNALRAARDRAFDAAIVAPPAASDGVAAYRALVVRADGYADERFARAAEIGTATAAMRELRREEAELDEAERRCDALAEERVALDAEWADARTPFLATARTPAEAIERLSRIVAAVALAREVSEMRERRDQLAALAERLIAGLRAVLVTVAPADAATPDVTPPDAMLSNLSLGMLVQLARRRQVVLRERESRRAELRSMLDGHRRSLPSTEAAQKDAAAALAAWETEWVAATVPLRLATALAPEDAPETLDAFGSLSESWRSFSADESRIAGIERDRDAFIVRAEEIVERCALPRLRDLHRDPFGTIDELRAGAETARDATVRAEERQKQIARKAEEAERLRESVAELARRREALLVPSGITPDEAELALDRRDRHDALLDAIGRLRAEARAATRREPEELVAELTVHGGASGVSREIERLTDELSREQTRRRALLEECGAKRDRQGSIRASREALESQADAMAIGAEIERHARRYAALTAARMVLAERMDAYAAAHQGPVIEAASRALAVMTLGRYERVQVAENETGVPVLRVVERDGAEKAVEALSEGTKDQLYLALRLATLEDRLGRASGPPLLLDDALKNFDDARTVEALRALGDFSRCVQVIYFTPRSIVAEFAREALGADDVDVVEVA